MASSTNRGQTGHPTGAYGAAGSTATTQAPQTEAFGSCATAGTSGGGVAGGLMDKAQEIASNLGTTAGDAWDSTRQGVQQAASAVADTAGDAFETVTGFMRRYPFVTLCFGFGVGFLVGRVLANRGTSDSFGGGSRYNWWDEESRQARTYGRYNPSNVSP